MILKRELNISKDFSIDQFNRFTASRVRLSFYANQADRKPYQQTPTHYVITGGEIDHPLTKLETYRLKMG